MDRQAPSRRHCLKTCGGLWAAVLAPVAWAQDPTGGDKLGSMQWPVIHRKFMATAPFALSDEVIVKGPEFAEDAMNVPIWIDARALQRSMGPIDRIVVVADRNPIQHVLDFEPLGSWPVLAFRIRMEQASPVRAFVQTRDGQWHVGSTWVKASGGGCTVPGITRADGSWVKNLNQVQTRFFYNPVDGSRRLRLRVMHPMDTGLVAGIPAFHVEDLRMVDAVGEVWWALELHEPVSENPLITFELPVQGGQGFKVLGRDNNGNRIEAEVSA